MTQIAIVPYKVSIDPTMLARVAAALQRQVHEHFAPAWQVDASVSAFHEWDSVPIGYARLALVDKLDSGSLGVHNAKGDNGLPYALVGAQGDWSVVASHELLEMLADPTGCALRKGPSPMDGRPAEILVEVCDPCQGMPWSYRIDGIAVSDFCTPAFYDGSGKGPWSYTGKIQKAGQILKGGYMIWHDPADQEWWRRDWLGTAPTDYALGKIAPDVNCLRGHIDRITRRQRPRSRRAAKFVAPVSRAAKSKSAALAREVAAAFGPDRTRSTRRR